MNFLASGMLQCSGNMKIPSLLHVLMCTLDVCFNLIFIFPTRSIEIFSHPIIIPGAGLGVAGAAIGTAFAELVTTGFMLYFLLARSPMLHIRKEEKLKFSKQQLLTIPSPTVSHDNFFITSCLFAPMLCPIKVTAAELIPYPFFEEQGIRLFQAV